MQSGLEKWWEKAFSTRKLECDGGGEDNHGAQIWEWPPFLLCPRGRHKESQLCVLGNGASASHPLFLGTMQTLLGGMLEGRRGEDPDSD